MPTAPNRPADASRADPSTLTTELVYRAVDGLRDVIEARLNAMQKAVDLLQSNADKSPTIGELNASHEERFRSIATQFTERDTRADTTAQSIEKAIAAALQASKELGAEQNRTTSKQLDQLDELFKAAAKASDDKASDLKDRITAIESRSAGGAHLWSLIAGIATLLLTAAGVFGIAFKLAR